MGAKKTANKENLAPSKVQQLPVEWIVYDIPIAYKHMKMLVDGDWLSDSVRPLIASFLLY
jgi:hypothetical protein